MNKKGTYLKEILYYIYLHHGQLNMSLDSLKCESGLQTIKLSNYTYIVKYCTNISI